MTEQPTATPGPIADRTYDSGFRIAAIAGAIGTVLLFWIGPLSVTSGSQIMFAMLFYPMYLLAVSIVLGVWLGYTTDERNLEPVYKSVDTEEEQ